MSLAKSPNRDMQEHLFLAMKMRSRVENVLGACRCDFYFYCAIGNFDSPTGLSGGVHDLG